jgi:hypothetical protein
MKKKIFRALIEMGFIMFLFYANLLMGEYERSGAGQKQNYRWVLRDILTFPNFIIALISSFLGYIFFEYLRKKF